MIEVLTADYALYRGTNICTEGGRALPTGCGTVCLSGCVAERERDTPSVTPSSRVANYQTDRLVRGLSTNSPFHQKQTPKLLEGNQNKCHS